MTLPALVLIRSIQLYILLLGRPKNSGKNH
jgi:hypothetical protein